MSSESSDERIKNQVRDIVWSRLSDKFFPTSLRGMAELFHAIASIQGGIGYTACHKASSLEQLLWACQKDLERHETLRATLRQAVGLTANDA